MGTSTMLKEVQEREEKEKREEESEEKSFVCKNCGVVWDDEERIHDGFCTECASECEECGCWEEECQNYYVYYGRYSSSREKMLCESCANEEFYECSCCGDLVKRGIERSFYDDVFCPTCYDNEITSCDECGTNIRINDSHEGRNSDNLCDECYNNESDGIILDYHDHPDLIFHKNPDVQNVDGIMNSFNHNFFMGSEIEISFDDNLTRTAEKMSECVGKECIYFNYDGSVDGFESITHPAQYEQMRKWNWEKFFEIAKENDGNNSGCGLHFHVSRAGLGRTIEEQDNTILKILYFLEKYWENIVRFTRRSEDDLESWAKRYDKDNEYEDLPKLKRKIDEGSGQRYHSLNLTNRHTVEFRIFKGTVELDEFLATMEFVYRLCKTLINIPVESIQDLRFLEFFDGYSNAFLTYCKEYDVLESEKDRFITAIKEKEIKSLQFIRICGNPYISLRKDNPFEKIGTYDFAKKYGVELLNIIISSEYPDFNGVKDWDIKQFPTLTLTPMIYETGNSKSFDGVEYACTNFRENDNTNFSTLKNIFFDRGFLHVVFAKDKDENDIDKQYYFRKFEETKLFCEVFSRI